MNPAEIEALVAAFQELEPIVQRGIAALVHALHGQPKTAQDYLAQAQALLDAQSKVSPQG